jgi:hypothetical protein
VEQIDNFAVKAVNSLLDMDLKSLPLAEDIKILIKKIPKIESSSAKAFLDKGIYLIHKGISELILYLNLEEFVKFLRTHSVNQKPPKECSNVFISEDKQYILIKTEFVIDNMTKTRLENGPLKNVLTIRQMNEGLVKGLALGWRFYKELNSGKTLQDLEEETGQNHRTIDRYINLVYLSPNIIDNIFNNINPKNFRLKELKILASTHADFKDQEREWGYLPN